MEYFESFPVEITKWEIIRGMVDLDLDDAQPVHSKEIPSVQLLPRQDVMRYGCIPKMDQVIYTKCKECKLVFNPRDILSHKSCSSKSISSTPHSSKKKVKKKGSSSKRPSSNLRQAPLFKEPTSPPNSNAPAPVPVSSASSSSTVSALPEAVVEMAVEKVTSSPAVKTTTTTTATSPTKSELAVSTSGSSKSNSAHSQKSHHPSWSSKMETGGSTSGSSSSHAHHHGHGHGHHHHHHHHSSSHSSNHGHSSNSSSLGSSRHKKSKKTNSSCRVAAKEFDPDVHCGVVESGKGPCTRSVTCSNHRIQLRKLVPGRSKDILQLIAEKKTSKEQAPSPNGLPEEKDSFSQSTTCVPLAEANASTNEPDKSKAALSPATSPKANDIASYSRQTTLHTSDKNENTTDMENKSLTDANVTVNVKEEDAIGTTPIGYMPMSPISVVAPVQDWKKDKEDYYLCLLKRLKSVPASSQYHRHSMVDVKTEDDVKVPIATTSYHHHSMVDVKTEDDVKVPIATTSYHHRSMVDVKKEDDVKVPISTTTSYHHLSMVDVKTEDDVKVPIATTTSVLVPIVNSSVKLYRSHPKPVAIPTYNTKKIGGAILISNPHVDSQIQEILMAINKHKMMNNTHGFRLNNHANHINHVNNHRPNILKVRSVNKVNCKRLATEKLNTGENKQVRLTPNVNGFILHSDISESAEAPQSNNNCLQQALLNMK